jgi:hypothetical protein
MRLLDWFLNWADPYEEVPKYNGVRLALHPGEAYIRRLEDTARTDGAFWLFRDSVPAGAEGEGSGRGVEVVGVAGVQVATGEKALAAFAQGASLADAYLASTGTVTDTRRDFVSLWEDVPWRRTQVQVRIFISLLPFGEGVVRQVDAFNAKYPHETILLCHFPRVLPRLFGADADLATAWSRAVTAVLACNGKDQSDAVIKPASAEDDLRIRSSLPKRSSARVKG